MTIELRPYKPEELRRFLETADAAFGDAFNEADFPAFSRLLERDRSICALEDGAMVGTGGAYSFRMTVPGGRELPVAGVTIVGVLPSHRRRGILTSMMRRQLDDVRERGEPLAILWASEGGIYQRFGYGMATLSGAIEIERSRATYRKPLLTQGRIRLVERDEAARVFPRIYERFRGTMPGALTRTADWWAGQTLYDPEHRRRGAGPLFHALHETDGHADGYALYRINAAWEAGSPSSTLIVREALGATPQSTAEVWRFLLDVDLVAKIRGELSQAQHPLLLLLAEPRRLGLRIGDGLWLRIVDLVSALEARTYGAEDSLVFELHDEFCPWLAGRWRVDAHPRGALVSPTEDDPDLVLGSDDLATTYLGAFSFSDLLGAGRAVERAPGAIARADRLFRTDMAPWSPGMF